MTHRHCDPVTMDHIIDLRKRVALLEKQVENVSSWITPMRKKNDDLTKALVKIEHRCSDDDSWLSKSIDIRTMVRDTLEGK